MTTPPTPLAPEIWWVSVTPGRLPSFRYLFDARHKADGFMLNDEVVPVVVADHSRRAGYRTARLCRAALSELGVRHG